jgi:cell wall-associated NlpC family hydrolase
MISQPVRIVRSVVLIAIVISAGVGCVSTPASNTSVGERAAAVAIKQVGIPYRYGGSTPTGFDCSGLVHYSYASVGKNIPRTTAGQWADLKPVNNQDLRSGDLLFFRISGKMSHVGMYLGDGRFVHAPSTGTTVSVANLRTDYYRKAFIRAGRPQN